MPPVQLHVKAAVAEMSQYTFNKTISKTRRMSNWNKLLQITGKIVSVLSIETQDLKTIFNLRATFALKYVIV